MGLLNKGYITFYVVILFILVGLTYKMNKMNNEIEYLDKWNYDALIKVRLANERIDTLERKLSELDLDLAIHAMRGK